MKVLLQRVSHASVTVNAETTGSIERGLLLFVGFGPGDSSALLSGAAEKIVNLRVFPGESSSFHVSVKDINGGILAVPQFTLYGDTKKGRRPDFTGAMPPKEAEQLFIEFVAALKTASGHSVGTGRFGAEMQVELLNDGPVTLMLEF